MDSKKEISKTKKTENVKTETTKKDEDNLSKMDHMMIMAMEEASERRMNEKYGYNVDDYRDAEYYAYM